MCVLVLSGGCASVTCVRESRNSSSCREKGGGGGIREKDVYRIVPTRQLEAPQNQTGTDTHAHTHAFTQTHSHQTNKEKGKQRLLCRRRACITVRLAHRHHLSSLLSCTLSLIRFCAEQRQTPKLRRGLSRPLPMHTAAPSAPRVYTQSDTHICKTA
jgi:hypothetical protein